MLAKKSLLVGIVALFSLSLAISAQPLHPATGEPLMMDCLRGTPDAIDGDLSDWNLEAMTPAVLDAVEQLSSGQDIWTGPEDCSAEFYMLWDDVNIYMAVVVKDEKLSMNKTGADIWNSDCVEMFFATTDAEADHSWSNPTIHYQYGFNANNQTWNWCNMDGPGQSVPDYLQVASSVTADGYICEASIEYAQMSALDFSVGNTIGIHPCIDDTDIDDGDTEYQMSWTGLAAHDQSMGYGHMLLSADSVPEPEPAPTIAWVSYHAADDEPHADAAAVGFTMAPDIGYTDLLKANGYDVVRVLTSQDPDVEYLNTFDLVIISRTASSSHYSGSGATLWNSITAPMINLNGYTLRNSRLGFTDGADMPDTTGDVRLAVTDPTHPIFAGIALTDGVMDNMYAEGAVPLPTDGTISRGISINNNNLDDEGTVLATIAEVSADTGPVGGIVIAELPAGATMQNSSGSPDDVLGGHRLVFLTGSREPSGVTGGQAAALYDLYPDGEKMFLNAVKYMIPIVPIDPGTDGLVAYYALENDANDSSGNGLDGTIVGEPVFVEGAVGMGLQLDGVDDYVDLGNDPLFDLTEQVTLSVWVNTQDIGTTQNNPWLGKGDTSYMIKGHRVENQIEFFVYDGGWYTAHADVGAEFNGEWHHAAGTFDGEQLKIYVDGELSVTSDYVGGIGLSTYNVAIGTNTQAGGRFSESIFDEAAIYSRALSEGEILYLAGFRAPVDPGTDSLVAHYAFENDLTDSSDNGLDGTAVGDPTFVEGAVGMALDFNGDDYVDCGGAAEFSFTDAMTVSTWVNIRSRPVAWMAMVAKGENAWRLGVNNETTGIHYAFSGSGRGWLAANTATELAFDEWYHVAATYDTNVGATVYIDGEPDASNPDLGGIDTNEFSLLLGDNPEATGRLLDGMLDEIMIYNRALSKEEVLFLAGQ